ncbi:phage tail assembly chaperone [Dyadobacter psychrotolerans]|uniref:Uncharacterized protein n=1 Tax=Dyadobacter psychrotolerans TaxID=2541721 RepID=A0A4R5DT69_9BACT|nr:hypothetical protein [Dyadobacter psychrotolerans]TDE17716.1 hypothetical protein E0F88_07445 [Dyadobacter psychrotolerans]
MEQLTVPSGAKVVMDIASFEDAMALKNAVEREIKEAKLSINLAGVSSTSDLDIGEFLTMAMAVDSSAEVNRCLMKCLMRCTYNGEKITANTFEPRECRQDYMPIMMQCMKDNLTDFFKPLVSKLFGLSSIQSTNTQKQE